MSFLLCSAHLREMKTYPLSFVSSSLTLVKLAQREEVPVNGLRNKSVSFDSDKVSLPLMETKELGGEGSPLFLCSCPRSRQNHPPRLYWFPSYLLIVNSRSCGLTRAQEVSGSQRHKAWWTLAPPTGAHCCRSTQPLSCACGTTSDGGVKSSPHGFIHNTESHGRGSSG